MFSELAVAKKDLQVFITDTNTQLASSLTTTRQELRSTVDHARDRVLEKLYETHRNEMVTLQCLYAHIEALTKALAASEMHVKTVERSICEMRADQTRILNTLRVFK